LTVRGKTTTVDHWKVTQAGETPTTTTLTVSDLNLGYVAGVLTDASD
jgi:hypothetical protein